MLRIELCITANSDGLCLLWVISGHSVKSRPCPLCPRKRTWISTVVMSALCQERTFCSAVKNVVIRSPRRRDLLGFDARRGLPTGVLAPAIFEWVDLPQCRSLGISVTGRMATFLYRCPDTGFRVQGYTRGQTSDDDDVYEAVTCIACTRVHLVLMLMIKSNLVGCITGRSPGFSPLMMRAA
jgi:hypothetical protein